MASFAQHRRRRPVLSLAFVGTVAYVFQPLSFVPGLGRHDHPTLQASHRSSYCHRGPAARAARGGEEAPSFAVGEAVEAVFPDDGNWYPGEVTKINGDGSFTVKWEDPDGGPEESEVSEIKHQPVPFDKIEVGRKYRGVVERLKGYAAFVDIGAECVGFLHISQVSRGRVDNIEDVLQQGQEVDVWISAKDTDSGRIRLTMIEGIREAQDGRGPAPDLSAFNGVQPDEWHNGVVTRLEPFGALVTVMPLRGGESADGLLYVSQIKEKFVDDAADELSVGQEVQVRVLSVDVDAGTMSLSMKAPPPERPSLAEFQDVAADAWLAGKVSRTMSYGAFVTVALEGGTSADGLVHISELKDGRVQSVEDVVSSGQEVQVRVLRVDMKARKLYLTMRKKSPRSAPASGGVSRRAEEKVRIESLDEGSGRQNLGDSGDLGADGWLRGRVKTVNPFGAYVTVADPESGELVDGLVHVSKIRDFWVSNAADELTVGEEVKVRVVSVDEKGLMDLSMIPAM